MQTGQKPSQWRRAEFAFWFIAVAFCAAIVTADRTLRFLKWSRKAAKRTGISLLRFCRWFYRWFMNPVIKVIVAIFALVTFPLVRLAIYLFERFLKWHIPRTEQGLCAEQDLSRAYQRALKWCLAHCYRPAFGQVFRFWDKTIKWGTVTAHALALLAITYHINYNRRDVPSLDAFMRFETPTIGHIYDRSGETFVELAKEYRRIVNYQDILEVVVQATLATEDKRFFSHSGLDYWAWPRIVFKFLAYSFDATNTQYDREKKMWPPRLIFPQGGSTITQQLVRNYFLQEMIRDESRGTAYKFKRKVEEARLSLWLEEELPDRMKKEWEVNILGNMGVPRPDFYRRSKEMIFARYASFVYMGNGRYGFAANSEFLFGKKLSEFTPDDADKAALMAGIVKSPFDYAPRWDAEKRVWTNLDRPMRRRNEILMLMLRRGFITDEQCKLMQARPLGLSKRPEMKTDAPAVVDQAMNEIKKNTSDPVNLDLLFEGKIQVHSTADKRLQQIANAALEEGLAEYEKRHPEAKGKVQGSVIVLRNSDGAILTEIGGRRFYKDKYATFNDFNRVVDALRQPGSAFKPFVYLAAILNGMDLETTVIDAPIFVRMGGGGVHWISNYDEKFKGAISLRKALTESRNAATIWVWYRVGNDAMIRAARIAGVRTKLKREPSTALGASEVTLMELTNAYRALASGVYAEPYIVREVRSSDNRLLYQNSGRTKPLDVEPAKLAMIQEGLRGVVKIPGGTAYWSLNGLCAQSDDPRKGCPAEKRIPVGGKTGTTTDFKDAIFIGFTPGPGGITIGVRVGFDNPGMGYDEDGAWGLGPKRGLGPKEAGGRVAIPIFKKIISEIYQQNLFGPIPRFPEELEHNIDVYMGLAPPEPPEEEQVPAPVPTPEPPPQIQ